MACLEKCYPKIIPFFTCRVEFWKITKGVNWGSNYQETGSCSSEKLRQRKTFELRIYHVDGIHNIHRFCIGHCGTSPP